MCRAKVKDTKSESHAKGRTHRTCVCPISPELQVWFLKYFTHMFILRRQHADARFLTACFEVKVIAWGQRSHTENLCPLHIFRNPWSDSDKHFHPPPPPPPPPQISRHPEWGLYLSHCLVKVKGCMYSLCVCSIPHEPLLWFWRYSMQMYT